MEMPERRPIDFGTICPGYDAEAEFSLSFSIDSLDDEPSTEKILIGNHLHWHLQVTQFLDYLMVNVGATGMRKYPMECDAIVSLHGKDPMHSIDEQVTIAYDSSAGLFCHDDYRTIALFPVIDELDKFEIEGQVTVTAEVNVRLPMCCNFNGANLGSDVKLIIDGVSFPLNKSVLAFHSPFFSAMFFGQFKEANQDEVTLENVDQVAFVNLINVLFVRSFELKSRDLAAVLELADRFGIVTIVDHCEKVLLNCERYSKPSLAERLVVAFKYSLEKLQTRCMELCDSPKIIKEVVDSRFYKDLSSDVAKILLERLVDLLPEQIL